MDIGENSVRFLYQMSQFSAGFGVAAFNGYELEFSPCIGFANHGLGNVTDIYMTADRVWSEANRLYVNVAALPYQASSQLDVSFDIRGC